MKNHFPIDKQIVVDEMLNALKGVRGIETIVLGGSFARGTANKDSDIDLGIYYFEKSMPSIKELREIAKTFNSKAVVTGFYEWGQWVNGGAWIPTKAGKIDWLYRNLDQVRRVIEEARQGRFSWDFRQQPPFGYFSATYLADLQQNIALYDPNGTFARLKEETRVYPEALRKAIIQEHLWSVEFTLLNAKKSAERGDIYSTVGCMTRMAAELTQALFALNRVYFSTEKEALESVEGFERKPAGFAQRLNAILSHPGKGEELTRSLKNFEEIAREAMVLAGPLYQPKYSI